jgi:hypothetical protein
VPPSSPPPRSVYVLEGGLPAWAEEGGDIDTSAVDEQELTKPVAVAREAHKQGGLAAMGAYPAALDTSRVSVVVGDAVMRDVAHLVCSPLHAVIIIIATSLSIPSQNCLTTMYCVAMMVGCTCQAPICPVARAGV